MPVITCPGCGVRLKVDPQPTSKFACPKCQKVMRLASPASSQSGQRTAESDPLSDSAPKQKAIQKSSASSAPLSVSSVKSSNAATSIDPSPTAMGLPPVDGGYLASNTGQYPETGSSAYIGGSSVVANSRPTDFKAFAKKLAIMVGTIAVVIIASLPLTYASNSFLRLVPILLVILALLGFVFWARIWFIVLGFAQSQSQGLMVLFVPYYWLFFLSRNKQQCIKPLIVFGASLVPGLLGVVVTTFFKPDFARSSSSNGLRLTSAQQDQARKILLKATSSAQPGEQLTAQFPIFMLMKPDAASLGEIALTQLPGYVPGSLKIAPDQKSLTLQYRGSDKKVAFYYAMVLPGEAGVMLGFEPTFVGNN